MRCIVHIWTQEERGRKYLSLHILPLNAPATLQSMEAFVNPDDLVRRLREIGLNGVQCDVTLHNLAEGLSAMWSDVEIAEGVAHRVPVAAA